MLRRLDLRVFVLHTRQNFLAPNHSELTSKKYLSSENLNSIGVNGVIILEKLRIRNK